MATTAKNSNATKESKKNVATISEKEALELLKKATPEELAQAKAESKNHFDLDAVIRKSAPIIRNAGALRNSLYKKEVMEGLSPKETKTRRRKIRATRDAFLGEFLAKKADPKALKALQKEWLEYATQVYNDINHIFETNTNTDDQELCLKFVKAMAQEYK